MFVLNVEKNQTQFQSEEDPSCFPEKYRNNLCMPVETSFINLKAM